ncbi:hypothetical protein DPMN_102495 [Dreissena polymorpha]|uniref:Uncharacterized protein n=1 Tax=Dreissena polymorpha TaxID=45954 RepID=A0A9D4LKG5_DREPO|nr:hypothetical protein DPMN_102495 [Dreissena polymorpha]
MNPAPEVQKMCLLVYESFTSRYRKRTRSTSHTLTIYSQRNHVPCQFKLMRIKV